MIGALHFGNATNAINDVMDSLNADIRVVRPVMRALPELPIRKRCDGYFFATLPRLLLGSLDWLGPANNQRRIMRGTLNRIHKLIRLRLRRRELTLQTGTRLL
jgi:hypothetical protein